MLYDIIIDGRPHKLELAREADRWLCTVDGEAIEANALVTRPDVLSIIIHGRAYEVRRERSPPDTHPWAKIPRFAAEVRDPRSLRSRRPRPAAPKVPRRSPRPCPARSSG